MCPRSPETSPFLARAEKRLAALGEARTYLCGLIGGVPGSVEAWQEVLELCDKALLAEAGDAGALRLKGRALSFLGQAPRALECLDAAVRLDAGSAQGWAWRGEARLLSGGDGARADLDRAVALGGRWPWARLLRAVCRMAQGDAKGAASDLPASLPGREAQSVGLALRALIDGQQGEPLRGARRLDGELSRRPSPFLHAVRGLLRRGAGDLEGSLRDFDKAAESEASPWVYAQRADALNRSGFYQKALDDLKRLSSLLPGSPDPHLQAANVLFDQAFYPEALAELEKALALAPEDPALLSRRARFLLVLTRLEESERDLRRAAALQPEVLQHRFELLQLVILQDRWDEALAELDRSGLPAPFDAYARGYAACRAGRYQDARRLFLTAASQADGPLSDRLRLYALVARVLGESAPSRAAVVEQFYLCGIGLRHPYQTTVEMVRALGACGVLYNNLGDPQVSEFLGLFRGEVRAVTRVFNEPAMGRVQRIVAGLRAGAPTGFVTRIHPFIYRRIAHDLANVCAQKGIPFKAFGAVSLTEIAWALGAAVHGPDPVRDLLGLRVFDMCWVNGRADLLEPRVPAVVYCIAGPDHRRRLCQALRGRYPASHVAYLLAGSGDREHTPQPFTLAELEAPLVAADLGAVLYVPAVRARRRKR